MGNYGSVDGLENAAQDAHIEDSLKVQKLKQEQNKNTTGLCEDCGEAIPAQRLETIPNANCCVRCQGERDRNPKLKIQYRNPYMP